MSDKAIENIINDELMKHKPEDRPVIAQMMRDKLTGTKTSKNDYKKLFKAKKLMKRKRMKNENR